MGIKKSISLRTAFWRFLFMLLGGLLGAVIIPYIVMMFGTASGIVTYSDFAEIKAKELSPIIAATPTLSEIQVPVGIDYVILDKDYQLLDTTLEDAELQQAIKYATTGIDDKNLNKQYMLVTRENEYVVLQYYIGSVFTNEWLNEHLPSPDALMIILIVLNCIFVCSFLTAKFAKNLRLQLNPLFEATEEVSKHNLDFELGTSNIKEFNEVLLSFSDMQKNLKTSLEQQWKTEQMQREQIAALAHDLKTPLTIIQGNADLINETDLSEEQHIYAGYIADSSEQMQQYIKILIDISRTDIGYQFHKEDIELRHFLNELKHQIEALCKTKELRLKMDIYDIIAIISADKLMLERAIMNVINNALEYSPQGGTIHIAALSNLNNFQIVITDEGEGFSQEDLLHAQEKFYMADHSRGNKLHFGMGLYITKSIIEQHKGFLSLENSKETKGAKVIISLPF